MGSALPDWFLIPAGITAAGDAFGPGVPAGCGKAFLVGDTQEPNPWSKPSLIVDGATPPNLIQFSRERAAWFERDALDCMKSFFDKPIKALFAVRPHTLAVTPLDLLAGPIDQGFPAQYLGQQLPRRISVFGLQESPPRKISSSRALRKASPAIHLRLSHRRWRS
jgi:hypothetical protein